MNSAVIRVAADMSSSVNEPWVLTDEPRWRCWLLRSICRPSSIV